MSNLTKLLKIDKVISEVGKLQNDVPANGTLPAADAMVLHVRFWSVKTKLTDIIAKVKSYEQDKKLKRNILLSQLKSDCEEKSEAAKERVAQCDSGWQKLHRERVESQVLREWLEMKRDDLGQAHIMARESLKLHQSDFITEPK